MLLTRFRKKKVGFPAFSAWKTHLNTKRLQCRFDVPSHHKYKP
jgi:hypothetical protein